MNFDIIPDEDALQNCCWCGEKIDAFAEVFDVGARLRPGIDLEPYRSHCIQIDLISRPKTLTTLVASEDSEARAEQQDLLFLVCSRKCAKKLRTALEKESAKGGIIDKPQ